VLIYTLYTYSPASSSTPIKCQNELHGRFQPLLQKAAYCPIFMVGRCMQLNNEFGTVS